MNETEPGHCCRCAAALSPGVPGALCAACLGSDLFSDPPDREPFAQIGDYELLEEIGRGGMGLVYRARQISVNRAAAVKLILTGPLASAVDRQRFVAEAEAAAALDHPGIVAVYEAGEEDGQPFFAMQLIEGESLSARLGRVPRMTPREAANLIRHTALAVQHAHERGFLHRDLKPANILLDARGAPHVTDFGLARRLGDESKLTLTGAAVGTPAYMAPEQTDTRTPPTTAVDVYSLGAIFYELLSGRPPFAERSLPELFVAIRGQEPASLSGARSPVDRDLDIICRKCLEKEPARRYRTAQALAEDLQRWLHGEPIAARAAGRAERLVRWCRRRPAIAGLAAAAAVFFLAGLAGIVWQWRRADREAAAAVAALSETEEALWQANLSEAKALRISRSRGQRTRSLAALARAAARRPSMELRNEAIAALALPDLGEPEFFPPLPDGARDLVADAGLTTAAYHLGDGIAIHRLGAEEPDRVIETPDLRCFYGSPDLDFILTVRGRENTARRFTATLWRVRDHATVIELTGAAPGIGFSADGGRMVLCREGQLEVRDTADGRILSAAPCALHAQCLAVSPDGRQAALFQSGKSELWSLTPPALLKHLPAFSSDMFNAQWHPGGESLVCGNDREAFVILPERGEVSAFTRHDREGVQVFMHPGGLFSASTSWDGILRFSHPALGEPLLQTSGLRPRRFSSNGRSLLVTSGARTGVCPVTAPDVWRCLPLRGDGSDGARSVEFSPDGKWLAVVTRYSLTLWNPATLRPAPPLRLDDGARGVFTGDRSLLVLDHRRGMIPVTLTESADGSLMLDTGGARQVLPGNFNSFVLSPDRTRVLVNSRPMAVYDLSSGAGVFQIHSSGLMDNPAWSPDGRWLATGYWNNRVSAGSMARVWSAADGSPVKELPAGNCEPYFTPDGRRLFISATHECVEYETGTWRELRRHPREASGLDYGAVAFAPDAGLAALMADESVIRLISLSTGGELARLTQPFPHKVSAAGLRFSPDGRWLVCEARKSIRIWDLRLLRERLRASGLDWADQPPARAQ